MVDDVDLDRASAQVFEQRQGGASLLGRG
jgi:hypothetical protein